MILPKKRLKTKKQTNKQTKQAYTRYMTIFKDCAKALKTAKEMHNNQLGKVKGIKYQYHRNQKKKKFKRKKSSALSNVIEMQHNKVRKVGQITDFGKILVVRDHMKNSNSRLVAMEI